MAAIPKSADVFVIGGGPAGLAAAIAARLKGLDVVVADAASPPIDKACGEGLMPDCVEALGRLGVAIDADRSFVFQGIRFIEGGVSAEASFPSGCAVGMRRTRLHQLLLERAGAIGVRLLWGTRVTGIGDECVFADGERVRRRWLIGADGQNSRVRRWAGLDGVRSESSRFAFRRHYRVPPWSDCMEIYWGMPGQMYVTPVSQEEVCVALITRDSHMRLDDALPSFPELNRRLAGAPSSTAERGAVTVSRRLRRVWRGSTALIGDASGSVDAITGEGLCLSFHQAAALAGALTAGDLSCYQAVHRRLARRPAFMGNLMLLLDRSRWLRGRVLRALSSNPDIFANLLSMHVGELPIADFLRGGMLPLGWQLLSA